MLKRFLILAIALAVGACGLPAPTKPGGVAAVAPGVLLDFESPNPAVTWVGDGAGLVASTEPGTQPATQPGTGPSALQRTSQRPQAGLWSLGTGLVGRGQIQYTPGQPVDLSSRDLVTVQVTHGDTAARNGQATAALALTDAAGKTVRGDAFAILSQWQPISFDLRLAAGEGLDVSRVVTVALEVRPLREIAADSPLAVQTDSWAVQNAARSYLGSSVGAAKSFYVESRGTRLVVGSVGQYEITLFDRGAVSLAAGNGETPPHAATWLAIATPDQKGVGQEATGLMLLDQSGLDTLAALRRQDGDPAAGLAVPAFAGRIPDTSWPGTLAGNLSSIHWSVVWTSPVAALVEGTQENGPYDRLGLPAVTIKWQLMIYQWGQVFVHARWTKSPDLAVADPITWALVTDDARSVGGESTPDRLLADIYTPVFREGLHMALPHEMQATASVAMIARTRPQKDTFWRADGMTADGLRRHIFGAALIPQEAALGPQNSADCMLLVNHPDLLTKATGFSQYLDPPKIIVRQGELDRNFPGDADNDGFVESYGFQVVRLANGRATFTIYPQQRPIFYPPFLFTIPAVERDALDVKHSQLLINIDGKQFANPPQFPDGSFLLQIPFPLNKDPVNVEAILVK